MFRLLGFLTLGNLLFGGRHHRRALRRGILFGALLGFLANRDFDMNRVRDEVRDTARKAGNAARKAANTVRDEIRNTRTAEAGYRSGKHADAAYGDERRTEREAAGSETQQVVYALPQSGTREAREIQELVNDMEKNTWAAAADVPTIQFPEEDGKYDASRKYGYVQ